MVYESQKDKEILIFPIVYVIISILIRLFCTELSLGTIWTVVILVGCTGLFVFCNMLTIQYIITETELIIKTVMFKTVLKLELITEIRKRKGIYSFSASSREQLQLTYLNGMKINISPVDVDEFREKLLTVTAVN